MTKYKRGPVTSVFVGRGLPVLLLNHTQNCEIASICGLASTVDAI